MQLFACRYEAVTLSKLELVLNTLSLGMSLIWTDTDTVHFGPMLSYFANLDADVALSAETCDSNRDFTPGGSLDFNQNTGVSFFRACPATVRLVHG